MGVMLLLDRCCTRVIAGEELRKFQQWRASKRAELTRTGIADDTQHEMLEYGEYLKEDIQ